MDCSFPGSSVHGILEGRILEWVSMPSSIESSWPRDWTRISCVSCIGRRAFFLTTCVTWETPFSISVQSIESLCHVWLFVTPWTGVRQASLSITNSWRLLKLMSFGDAIQPFHPLLSRSPAFNLSQHQALFQWVSSSHQVAKVLELQLQHQSFQWIFRVDFLYSWLAWAPCSPRGSQESSPTPQFKSISSLHFSMQTLSKAITSPSSSASLYRSVSAAICTWDLKYRT